MANRLITPIVVVLMLCALLHGCGYRFSVEGPGPRLGSGSAGDDAGPPVRLAIRDFRNRTFHDNLELAYTRAMRQEFSVGSGATIVAGDAQADYVMTGEIVSVSVPSLTFSTRQTREKRVDVVVRVTVARRRTGDVVWTGTATGTADFFVNRAPDVETRQDEIQFNQVLQERALEQAGHDAAENLAAAFWSARTQGVFSPAPSPSSPQSSSTVPPWLDGATGVVASRAGGDVSALRS